MKSFNSGELACDLLLLSLAFISVVNGVYIPPGPKYKCPTLTQIWPCRCIYSTDDGINLQCEQISLSSLSAGLAHISHASIPVQSLEITELNTKKLYGPLFDGLNLTKLVLKDSPFSVINVDSLFYVKDTLKVLQIINSNLTEYPYDALEQLQNLETLTIDRHSISNLTQKITGLGKLLEFRISNGTLSTLSKSSFQELGKINRLDLHGNQLKDFPKDAFQSLKNLEFFDISYNNFTKLDPGYFVHLTKLTWFNGSHNEIPEFKRGAFARNNFLRVIYLTHNKLKNIDPAAFRGMRLLRRLYLSDNQIAEVGRSAFASINKVGTIDLSRNQLKILDYQIFSNLPQAEILDVSQNRIREIKREAFKDLAYVSINMSHNNISILEKNAFINCVNITVLDMSHNSITNFTRGLFDENTYPTEFKLEFNQLKNLADVPLKTFHGIKILNVSYNALEEIPKNTFPKLYELHTLDLSHNNLSKIHPSIFTTLFSLRSINLSYNNMTILRGSTFGTIPTVIEIFLNNNKITTCSSGTFTQLSSLRHLELNHNGLKTVFQIPPSLSSLSLSYNRIDTLTKAWPVMNSLLRLDLTGNLLGDQLQGNSFENLGSLQELKLAQNNLSEIPAASISKLTIIRILDLSFNNIGNLTRKSAFGNLPVLMTIQLNNNAIELIGDKVFQGLLQLQQLDLSNNLISEVGVGAFHTLVSLRTLNLSRNSLQRTDNGTQCIFEDNLSLETLDLSFNQFNIITALTFPSKEWTPYRLTWVDLSHNEISMLNKDLLRGSSKIQSLNISSNQLIEIRPGVLGAMDSLQVLDLSNNSIGYLEPKALGPPKSIRILNLSKNRLRKFPVEALALAPNLHILNLTYNGLGTWEEEYFTKIEKNGTRVLLNHNRINCDCRFIPLLRYFTQIYRPQLSNFTKEYYADFYDLKCIKITEEFEGSVQTVVPVSTLTEADLQCDPTKDLLAPFIPSFGPIEIKTLEINSGTNLLELRWRLRWSKSDISGFKVTIEDRIGKSLWSQTYLYNKRSIETGVPIGADSICIMPFSSMKTQDEDWKTCKPLMSLVNGINMNSYNFFSSSSSSPLSQYFRSHFLYAFFILITLM